MLQLSRTRTKKSHELFAFMQAITNEMSSEYERIQKRATEDPSTAGDEGEENWATLLRGWLPPTYQVVTKGRILSENGIASPQVDVLVLHPTYPKHLLNKKLYLAGGVLAAFECKVTLKAEHISVTAGNSVEIRRHLPWRIGTPYKELHSSIIYGLLAHSHAWKSNAAQVIENVTRQLHATLKNLEHPRDMLDIVCIADLATWTALRGPWWDSVTNAKVGQIIGAEATYMCGSETVDTKAEYTPIGTMICSLINKLAREDPSLRPLSDYFTSSRLVPEARSEGSRAWGVDIFSDLVNTEIARGRQATSDQWDEWNILFF